MKHSIERSGDGTEMTDEFLNFMGYRYTVIEHKINECLAQVREGETQITVDRGDLTDDEVTFLKREVRRRADKYYGKTTWQFG